MVSPRRSRPPWLGVTVVAAALVTLAFALVSGADEGPRPPFLGGEPPLTTDPLPETAGSRLRLAGSGSNLAVTRALASAYLERGGASPVVHASIGSSGGLRALLDGAIDVALISRPLSDQERAKGLFATPYVEMPVFVAVHATVTRRDISVEELLRVYRGDLEYWADGAPIVALQREPGDSSHAALERVLPQFAAVNNQAYEQNRWQVLYHDASMVEALENIEGSIGLQGGGRAPGAVGYHVLSVDGIAPIPENVASGRYPFSKTLSFATIGVPQGEAAKFIDFVTGPDAEATIRSFGGLPLPGGREGR